MITSVIAYLTMVTLTLHARELTPKNGPVMNTCTAVYVAPHRALTASHCIEKAVKGKIWVRNSDKQSFSVRVIYKTYRPDLALLEIDGPPHEYVSLASVVTKGERVQFVSSMDGMVGTYSQGMVNNIVIEEMTDTPMIVHSATILPGASGGGVFNARGQLIGINVLAYKGVSYAVDLEAIKRFLAEAEQRRKLKDY